MNATANSNTDGNDEEDEGEKDDVVDLEEEFEYKMPPEIEEIYRKSKTEGLDFIDQEIMSKWWIKEEIRMCREKGSLQQKTRDYVAKRSKDPKYMRVAAIPKTGKLGLTNEAAVAAADISWRETTEPNGPAGRKCAHRKHLQWLEEQEAKLVNLPKLEDMKGYKEQEIWYAVKIEELKEINKQKSLLRVKNELPEEIAKVHVLGDQRSEVEKYENYKKEGKFELLHHLRAPNKEQMKKSIQDWNIGFHPEWESQSGFPVINGSDCNQNPSQSVYVSQRSTFASKPLKHEYVLTENKVEHGFLDYVVDVRCQDAEDFIEEQKKKRAVAKAFADAKPGRKSSKKHKKSFLFSAIIQKKSDTNHNNNNNNNDMTTITTTANTKKGVDDVVAFEEVVEDGQNGAGTGTGKGPLLDKPIVPRPRLSTNEPSSNQKLTDVVNDPDGPTTTNNNNSITKKNNNNFFLRFLTQIFPNSSDNRKSQSRIHPQHDHEKIDDRSVGSHFSQFNGSISNMLQLALGNMSVGSMTTNNKKNKYKVNDNHNNTGDNNVKIIVNDAGKSSQLAVNTNNSTPNSVVTDDANRKKDVTDTLIFRVCKPISEILVESFMPNTYRNYRKRNSTHLYFKQKKAAESVFSSVTKPTVTYKWMNNTVDDKILEAYLKSRKTRIKVKKSYLPKFLRREPDEEDLIYYASDMISAAKIGDYDRMLNALEHVVSNLSVDDVDGSGETCLYAALTRAMEGVETVDMDNEYVKVSRLQKFRMSRMKKKRLGRLGWTIKILLKLGADINYIKQDSHGDDGYAIVHMAAESGDVELLKWIIGYDANVNRRSLRYQKTPLMLAASKTEFGTTMVLLRNGALSHIDCTDIIGNTALHYAAIKGDVDYALALIKCGAKINIRNKSRRTPAEEAQYHNKMELFAALQLAREIDVGTQIRQKIDYLYGYHELNTIDASSTEF